MMEKILAKLTSGRFWLTLVSGITFAYATYARILPDEVVATLLTMVFTLYFTRKRDE